MNNATHYIGTRHGRVYVRLVTPRGEKWVTARVVSDQRRGMEPHGLRTPGGQVDALRWNVHPLES